MIGIKQGTGGGSAKVTNGTLTEMMAVSGTVPKNYFVTITGGGGKYKRGRVVKHGLTKTECTATQAGKVWILSTQAPADGWADADLNFCVAPFGCIG